VRAAYEIPKSAECGADGCLTCRRHVGETTPTARRSIERALYLGEIVPTSRTPSGRARFDEEYSGTLKRRIDEQRARGRKHGLLKWAISSDPLLSARREPKNQPTSREWVKQMLWKRRNLYPHSPTMGPQWPVVATYPSGQQEHISGFETESDARNWITRLHTRMAGTGRLPAWQ
jgi:hypothetical protein